MRGRGGWRLVCPPPSLSYEERAPHPHLNPEAGWGQPPEALFFFPGKRDQEKKAQMWGRPGRGGGSVGLRGRPEGRGAAAAGPPSLALPVCKVHHEASTFFDLNLKGMGAASSARPTLDHLE